MTDDKGKFQAKNFADPDGLAQSFFVNNVFDPEDGIAPKKYEDWRNGVSKLTFINKELHRWESGVFKKIDEERDVVGFLQGRNESIIDERDKIIIRKTLVNDICLNLKGRISHRQINTWLDGREKTGINTIPLKNGLLMLDKTGKATLAGHTPAYCNIIQLPYEYDPSADCPLFKTFLNDIMLKRKQYEALLQEFIGYLFRTDLREQKFLLCVGEGANGKGVLFEVIEALVGEENCSQVPLSRFNNPFALYPTYGKVVNLTNESCHIIEEQAEGILKSFVAGDRFTFERKFLLPVEAVPTAKILIATNALPRFNDKTQGIWRRVLLVPFDYTVPEDKQFKTLADELKRELPGILNFALDGLRRLNQDGFTVPDGQSEQLEEYRKDADPCRAFLTENFTESPNGEDVPCSEVYKAYATWCKDNGCIPMNSRTFGQQVHRIFHGVVRDRIGRGENREYVYKGLVPQEPQVIPT